MLLHHNSLNLNYLDLWANTFYLNDSDGPKEPQVTN